MRKNLIRFTAIALLSCFALTACDDDIVAKPTGYDDNSPVVSIEGFDGTIENNNFKDIYDSIRSGALSSDVLDELLYEYAVSMFGSYNAVTAKKGNVNFIDKTTFKKAVAGLTIGANDSVTGANNEAKQFINDHQAFWTKNSEGKRVDDTNKLVNGENPEPSPSELSRLYGKWLTIEKRIAEKMYSSISGGSYSERNVFEEERYLRSLAVSIENKVINVETAISQNTCFKGVLTSKVEDYQVFDVTSANLDGVQDYILHRGNYQENYRLDQTEDADSEITYVEDKIIPDIYRQLLVEQYILDEDYDLLRRTNARKVSVLAIKKNSEYSTAAFNLMNTFVNDYIFDTADHDPISLTTFKMVSDAWIGAFMSDATYYPTSKEYALLEKAIPANKVDGANPYFKGTAYGDMMEEIEKINTNPAISENEGTYTGGNAYPVEVGKQIKTRQLQLEDHTSTGWYIKSAGVEALPDELQTQLFNINVANAQNGDPCVEYTFDTTANKWTTNEDDVQDVNLINVVGKVNGQLFLRNTTRVKGSPVESDLLFEHDGTFYVVLVEDAIRSKNLSKEEYNGASSEKIIDIEKKINEIVEIVGNNESYKTLSKKHWLEEMNLKYHDQVVYTYFKTNFPELFEDD